MDDSMADSTDDQLYELTAQINRLVKLFGGGGESPFSSPGTSKGKVATALAHTGSGGGGFLGRGISGVHGAIKTLHGGVDDMFDAVRGASRAFGEIGIAVGALTALFEGALKLSKTYNRMSDIGETFGGKILNMATQAGAAGLSLEEFAALQSRHSVLTAMMNDSYVASTQAQRTQTKTTTQVSQAQTVHNAVITDAHAAVDRYNASIARAGSAASTLGDQHDTASDSAAAFAKTLTSAGVTAAGSAATMFDRRAVPDDSAVTLANTLTRAGGTPAVTTGDTAFAKTLSDAAATASQITRDQIALNSAISQAGYQQIRATMQAGHQQVQALSRPVATQEDPGALIATLADAAQMSAAMIAKQGAMTESVAALRQQLTGTTASAQLFAGTMAGLSARQSISAIATGEYNKQINAATSSATALAISQGVMETLTGQLGTGLARVTQSTEQMSAKQAASDDLTTRFNLAVGKMGQSAAQMATEQGATSSTTLRLNEQLGVVAASSSAIAVHQNDLGLMTGDLSKQTSNAAATVAMMATKQGNIGDQSAQLAKQMETATVSAKWVSETQRGIGGDMTSLNKQFNDVVQSTAGMAQKQAVAGDATDQYNKAMAEGKAILGEMNAGQVGALGATELFTKQFQGAANTADDIKKNQAATSGMTVELNRHINDASSTFVKMAEKQSAVGEWAAKIDEGLLDAASSLKPGQVTDPTISLQKPFASLGTTAAGVTKVQTQMGAQLAKTDRQLAGFADSTDKQADAAEGGSRSTTLLGVRMADLGQSLMDMVDANGRAQLEQTATTKTTQSASRTAEGVQTKSLAQLSLAVRDNLEQFGFYGMTVSDLNNATSDYMETMRLSGQLTNMGDRERTESVSSFVKETSDLAVIYGKSRDALIKATTDLMSDPVFASANRKAGKDVTESSAQVVAAIEGSLGHEWAQAFVTQTGANTSIPVAEMVKANQAIGMQSASSIVIDGFDALRKSGKKTITPEDVVPINKKYFDDLQANEQWLTTQATVYQNAQAKLLLKTLNEAQGKYFVNGTYNQAKALASMKQDLENAKIKDALDQQLLTLPNTLEKIKGGFMEGYYGSLAELMGGGDSQQLKTTMEMLRVDFLALGRGVGTFLAYLLSPKSMSILTVLFDLFQDVVVVLGGLISAVGWVVDAFKGAGDFVSTLFDGLRSKLAWLLPDEPKPAAPVNPREAELMIRATVNKDPQAIVELKKISDDRNLLASNTEQKKYETLKANEDSINERAASDDIRISQPAKEQKDQLKKYRATDLTNGEWDQAKFEHKDTTPSFLGALAALTGAYVGWKALKTFKNLLFQKPLPVEGSMGLPTGGRRGRGGIVSRILKGSMAGDCCDGLTSGLKNLGEKVDFHGERAHKNAKGLAADIGDEISPSVAPPGGVVARRPTIREAWKEKGFWKGAMGTAFGSGGLMRSMGGLMVSALAGVAADAMASGLMDTLPNFPYKDTVTSIIGPIAGLLGAAFGPTLLSAAGSLLVSGITTGVTAFLPLLEGIMAVGMAALPFILSAAILAALASVVGVAVHEAMAAADPDDKMGSWIDAHIPGASFLDNAASKIGFGRSYDQQATMAQKAQKGSDPNANVLAMLATPDTPQNVGPDAGSLVGSTPDNLGDDQSSQAGDQLGRLQLMQQQLQAKTNVDTASGNPFSVRQDVVQMNKLLEQIRNLLHQGNKEQKDSNDGATLDRAIQSLNAYN
jgi:hypothetical protein